MSDRITIVSGFPRTGSSLVMQMLSSAGIQCTGEWPAFEDDRFSVDVGDISQRLMETVQGGAVKILDPQLVRLPGGFGYDFIWLRRNRYQQARSMVKFLSAIGLPVDESKKTLKSLRVGFDRDEPAAIKSLRSHAGHRWIEVRFEDLIEQSDATVKTLAEFLSLNPEPMRRCIVPRQSSCLRTMIEVTQLDSLNA